MTETRKTLALDIGGTRIKMAIVEDGRIVRSAVIPALSQGKLSDRLSDIERAVSQLAEGDFSPYCGMGIAMPCLVDPRQNRATEIYGKFEDAPSLDMAAWAKERFGLPVVMEQDSKAALLGEVMHGVARGYRDVLLIIMGTGVGTAVMMDGRVMDSRHHFAGALASHIVVQVDGRKCACNNSGCLEAYTSGWALPGLIRSHEGFESSVLAKEPVLDFSALERAARGGDRVGADVLETVVRAMRAGIVSMIHAYDPAAVILCGGPLNMGDIFTSPLLDGITEHLWGNGNDVRFLIADRPDESVLLGLHYLAATSAQAAAEGAAGYGV